MRYAKARTFVRATITILAALAGLAPIARATETQWWLNDAPADYARAEVHGAVLRPDATVEMGPATASWKDDSLRTAWAVAPLADGSVAVAGDHGRIDRWTAREGLKPWVRLRGGQVFALARDGNTLLAGTGPSGLVYRIGAKGDTALVARTGEAYVWALVPGAGGIWAATGARGRLLRIEGGKPRIVFAAEESNLLCLASDGAGGVYAGGDSKGRVYHVSAAGAVRTEFDAPEDEVRALVRGADGAVWAAALAASATSSDDAADDEEKPGPARGAVTGAKSVIYRLAPDSTAVAMWTATQPMVFALAPSPQGVVAATGNRAGLYRIERPGGAAQLLVPPQGQVTALATGDDGALWAATSNPVALWRLGPARAAEGDIVSGALDCHHHARFGHVRWHAQGRVTVYTRSGNCDVADSTWSEWAAVTPADDGGVVRSPGARYLQWKAVLGTPDARLDGLDIAWREQNLEPRVDAVGIAPQGLNFRDGELSPRSESVTQALPSGQKVEYSISVNTSKPIRELPVWARGMRTLTWRAVDPNGDALTFRLEIRNQDGGEWIEIGKDLDGNNYTWTTNTIPDGRYRVRVTASDANANAIGEGRSASAESEAFTIDNTPPEFVSLTAKGAHIEGEAVDAMSPLWRFEVAVDDQEWRTVAPAGGLADARRQSFAVTLPGLKPGAHLVSVRVVDLAGNSTSRAVTTQVPAAR